jgi:excisionase family DNA binding protein
MGDDDRAIRGLATVTLDVRSLDERSIERLAQLVAEQLAGQRGGEPADRLLSVDAVAELAGCSRSLVYREIARGNLPAYKVGTRLRIEPAALESWKVRCQVRPRSAPPIYEPVQRGPAGARVEQLRRPARRDRTCGGAGGMKITRLPDGRWRLRYYVAGHGSPKRQRTFTHRKDAERFAAEVERRKELSELVLFDQANRRVEELAAEWWRRHVVPNLAEWTRRATSRCSRTIFSRGWAFTSCVRSRRR